MFGLFSSERERQRRRLRVPRYWRPLCQKITIIKMHKRCCNPHPSRSSGKAGRRATLPRGRVQDAVSANTVPLTFPGPLIRPGAVYSNVNCSQLHRRSTFSPQSGAKVLFGRFASSAASSSVGFADTCVNRCRDAAPHPSPVRAPPWLGEAEACPCRGRQETRSVRTQCL